MKIFHNELVLRRSQLSSSYFLLDIETTGLLKAHDAIICIGVIYKNVDSTLCSIQWFAEHADQEKEILKCFLEFCNSFQKAYTYNGSSFDIPFILSRLDYHSLEASTFKSLLFLDIKKVFSNINLKRRSLEHLLGYQRQTTVTGKELAKLYKAFEATLLLTYQTIIVNHNLDELDSLLSLYEFYYILYRLLNYKVLSFASSEGYLQLDLQLDFAPHTCCSINIEDFYINWVADIDFLTLKILSHEGVLKKYLVPAKDYFLVKDENQLIHKSIAQFIPAHLKQKVTKTQCFITKSGTFIKLYKAFTGSKLSLESKPSIEGKFPLESKPSLEGWYNEHNELFVEYQKNEQLNYLLIEQLKYVIFS